MYGRTRAPQFEELQLSKQEAAKSRPASWAKAVERLTTTAVMCLLTAVTSRPSWVAHLFPSADGETSLPHRARHGSAASGAALSAPVCRRDGGSALACTLAGWVLVTSICSAGRQVTWYVVTCYRTPGGRGRDGDRPVVEWWARDSSRGGGSADGVKKCLE